MLPTLPPPSSLPPSGKGLEREAENICKACENKEQETRTGYPGGQEIMKEASVLVWHVPGNGVLKLILPPAKSVIVSKSMDLPMPIL